MKHPENKKAVRNKEDRKAGVASTWGWLSRDSDPSTNHQWRLVVQPRKRDGHAMRFVRCRCGTFPPSHVHRGQQTGLWWILLSGTYRSWGATTFAARTYRNRSDGGWDRGTCDRGCRGRRRGETTFITHVHIYFPLPFLPYDCFAQLLMQHFDQRIVHICVYL